MQLAEQIRKDTPNLSSYRVVQVYSCEVGSKNRAGEIPAQTLSSILQMSVRAPDKAVWIAFSPFAPFQGIYGYDGSGNKNLNDPGRWVDFRAGGQ